MYVQVELRGNTLQDRCVLPRSAVHDTHVYISTPENRLEIRPVEIEFTMADMVVVSAGLELGETLVLADLMPAVQGMLLKPVQAGDVLARLKQQALGEADIP